MNDENKIRLSAADADGDTALALIQEHGEDVLAWPDDLLCHELGEDDPARAREILAENLELARRVAERNEPVRRRIYGDPSH